jgi:UDP-N-acetylmuramyl tripeptide synthase
MNEIENTLKNISAVFGRQEKINYHGKNIQIFLSKNPTSFNQSIATIFDDLTSQTYNFLFVLNDDIPDGRDVSWIWDIDIEEYMSKFTNVTISGSRAYDMALRFQYGEEAYQQLDDKYHIEPDLKRAVNNALERTPTGETLYILPTYSAMLQIRKILTGRKIL